MLTTKFASASRCEAYKVTSKIHVQRSAPTHRPTYGRGVDLEGVPASPIEYSCAKCDLFPVLADRRDGWPDVLDLDSNDPLRA